MQVPLFSPPNSDYWFTVILFWQSGWKSMCLKRRLLFNPEERIGCCGLFMGTLRWRAFRKAALYCSSPLYELNHWQEYIQKLLYILVCMLICLCTFKYVSLWKYPCLAQVLMHYCSFLWCLKTLSTTAFNLFALFKGCLYWQFDMECNAIIISFHIFLLLQCHGL